jgi:SAM-dependent MidA family methyltransferase
MLEHNNPLSEIIIQKMTDGGPLSFHDFMEMCLYYPGLGYYTSIKDKIGQKGDYYTSPYLTAAFGAMIARQLEEMWHNCGKGPFTVVEIGAGMGTLTVDILNELKKNERLFDQLNYCIVEKSPAMREKEKEILAGNVTWYDSISCIPHITGCILSNELLDNFSIHQVIMQDELMEVFVEYNDGFTEVLKPAMSSLKKYLTELNIILPKGFRTEINLEALEWIKQLSGVLKKGYLLTIDYGHLSSELYKQCRNRGTLMCYHQHTLNDQPYLNIGEQDITSHVNFSALHYWGLKNGFNTCGFTNQASFLLGLGFDKYLMSQVQHQTTSLLDHRKYAFLRYTMLVEMGSKFKVLIQQKGMSKKRLSGLSF